MSNNVHNLDLAAPANANAGQGVQAYCDFLEAVTPENLHRLRNLAARQVHFRDPFNGVNGVDEMIAIFEDMFKTVGPCTFKIHGRTGGNSHCFITWTLTGVLFGKPWSVDGASELRFDDDGLLSSHIDFWDAAQGVYEHFPVIGGILKMLRRRLST